MKAVAPDPEVKEAILPSEGLGDKRPTRHTFSRTVEARDHRGGPCWHYMFKCTVSGVERVWGQYGIRGDDDEKEPES